MRCSIGIVFLTLIIQAFSGSQFMMDPTVICKKTKRLRGKLMEICKNEPSVLREITKGIQMATEECQFQFRNRRWNCTLHKKILQRDSKETSFVNAVIAAGVSYMLTRACSKGSISHCECGNFNKEKIPKPNFNIPWKWGGCNDNIQYGLRKAKTFMDISVLDIDDLKSLTMLHNLEAGRQVIRKSMHTECKCHGFSGSCVMKTCWRSLRTFRNVGDILEKRFRSSVKVVASNNDRPFIVASQTFKPPDKRDLVYSESSPNFCIKNKATGSLGTRGRQCFTNTTTIGSCQNLCCDRGYNTSEVVKHFRCDCAFSSGYTLVCKTCSNRSLLYHCV